MRGIKIIFIILFILIGTLVSCDYASIIENKLTIDPESSMFIKKEGVECTVQFNRNILGQFAEFPTPPITEVINGAEVQLKGHFIAANNNWVIIAYESDEIWIRKENILLIQFHELNNP